jgi:hypothetical protein
MRLSVEGAGSPELPLRLLNLLAQHGATLEHAVLKLDGDGYRIVLGTAPMAAERGALIVEKIRAMVLVRAAEVTA